MMTVWLMTMGLACISYAAPNTAPDLKSAIQLDVEKYSLPNGMTVLLHPDNSNPSVSVNTWYRVGSKDEKVGRTGLAHFFEHMMFKGTKKFPANTWGKFLNSKGADMNAFTSTDYTGYYINAPADQLELLLQIESDRMRNLALDPKDVNSEREVVKEERRMNYEDSIEGSLREKMGQTMYEKLPYRWLPIGYMVDLNAASLEDLHAFYKQFYSPNNAVLVVAGAIDKAQTKKWIETYYGKIESESIQRPTISPEPAQKAVRQATIERAAQAPSLMISYPLPDLNHPDHYALDILAAVMGQGQSSRLYSELVYKKQQALNIAAWSNGQLLGGDFTFFSSLKPTTSPDKMVKDIEAIVKVAREKPITAKELEKAQNQISKSFIDSLKRVSGRARTLARYEIAYGDYNRMLVDFSKYQEVTIADVKRVAATYLKPERRNIVVVKPKKDAKAGGKK
jgi:zinc protease